MTARYGIGASLTIRAPLGSIRQPAIIDDAQLGRILKRIVVNNALAGPPGGSFEIELAPGAVGGAYDEDLGEIIEPRSLVEIAVHRYSPDREDPTATPEPVVLMVGIVDFVNSPQDFGQRDPQRRVSLSGRSLAGLLVDHKWWFHNFLAREGLLQDLPADIRELVTVKLVDQSLRDEQDLRSLGFLAIDDKLYDATKRDPVSLLARTYDFFVRGYKAPDGSDRPPFIKVRFSDDLALADRLRFDADFARARWVDPNARLLEKYLPTRMPEASAWDVCKYFCEERFVELFADAAGAVGAGYVAIVARKPPWQGRIRYQDGRTDIEMPFGASPKTGESLFDPDTPTVYFDGSDLIGRPRMTRGLGAADAYSLYAVLPAGFTNIGGGHGMLTIDQLIPPLIDEDPLSPSYIERIGVRPLRHQTRYIPILLDDQQTARAAGDYRLQCIVYEALLREWLHRVPACWFGTITLKGNAAIRVGMRLVDRTRPREYYVTGVRHEVSVDRAVRYHTTATVARGWTLAEGA